MAVWAPGPCGFGGPLLYGCARPRGRFAGRCFGGAGDAGGAVLAAGRGGWRVAVGQGPGGPARPSAGAGDPSTEPVWPRPPERSGSGLLAVPEPPGGPWTVLVNAGRAPCCRASRAAGGQGLHETRAPEGRVGFAPAPPGPLGLGPSLPPEPARKSPDSPGELRPTPRYRPRRAAGGQGPHRTRAPKGRAGCAPAPRPPGLRPPLPPERAASSPGSPAELPRAPRCRPR